MDDFTVHKRNAQGQIELSYRGQVVDRGATFVCVRAIFQPKTVDLGYVLMKQGDIFIEWFYSDRWYNVFMLFDVDDKMLKGYYCNLTRPAIIAETEVAADDLALDLFVKPDGAILILDQDEYAALKLPVHECQQVEHACKQIADLVQVRQHPFHEIAVTSSG